MQIVSDIHLDFYNYSYEEVVTNTTADYLAILGDIGLDNEFRADMFFSRATRDFKQIYMVAGNHDLYNKTHDDILEYSKKYSNVVFLENQTHQLLDYTVLGCTLWSNVNDAVFTQDSYHFTNESIRKKHTANRAWLESEVSKHDKVIVMTHHMPSFSLISEKYKRYTSINSAFASNMDDFIKKHGSIRYWLFGHTHDTVAQTIGKCVCACNSRGYDPLENSKYDASCMISL